MKLRLAEFTSRLVGKPYRLGEMDCARLIMAFAEHTGVKLPESWKGYPVADYADLYREDPAKAMGLFIEWATSVGVEIDLRKAFSGDLLLASVKRNEKAGMMILIHAGQGQGMCVLEKRGVGFVPLRAYNILKAYRWRERLCRL